MKLNPNQKLKDIVKLIGDAAFLGDAEFTVTGINEIHKVEYGDLTFVDHPKYYDKALGSNASVIIINRQVPCPEGKCVIFSDNPFRDYNLLTRHFRPFVTSANSISDNVIIGLDTVVQPGVFIGNSVKIGSGCIIHSNVSIYDHVEIGNNVIIHSNSVIGADAFYYQRNSAGNTKMHSCGTVIIKDNVEIGACCTIDKGVSAETIIGEGTKLDNHVHIGHDTVIGKNCLFAAQVGVSGVVTIGDNVILWGQVGVQKDLTIHDGAVVLGQSGVAKSLEGNKVYFGSPTRDAKLKMKELAMLKKLPEVIEYLYKNNQSSKQST
ncbi:MAG: UDP-3-O-(3-hydroxymyristoyl)glucosamine N-acyltransferase [Bacteroidota bacterium]